MILERMVGPLVLNSISNPAYRFQGVDSQYAAEVAVAQCPENLSVLGADCTTGFDLTCSAQLFLALINIKWNGTSLVHCRKDPGRLAADKARTRNGQNA
jgi:hypothetical protein